MIQKDDAVLVTDADGNEHPAVALSSVETAGHNFPVIWVRFADGQYPPGVPWPVESVRVVAAVES